MRNHSNPLIATVIGLALLAGAAPGLLNAQPAGAPAPSASASGSAKPPAVPSGSAAPPASASATPPASASVTTPSTATAAPLATTPAMPPKPAGPPDPSADQIAALAELQREAAAYEANAKEYRSTITRIVKHHYEERKRRILSALDRELAIEKKALIDAREEAIRRLEIFIEKYSGANAHPENTPDAMFRLAALYEEKARADETDITDEQLAERLQKAVTLYKRIIKEFPKYRELAGVFYYLGHALND
jgi:tetratricopeptide (TPR) repeat protein